MTPVSSKSLSKGEREAALQYLMFLKKKRCGKIKGRGCADGRKQRIYATKDDVSSPTVATEALLLTCLIDAMEHRDVATVDIPGAFMQSDMEGIHGETTYMKLEGKTVDILKKLDPKLYEKHTTYENGKQILYVKLEKALYGTIQASLLFWKNLTKTLQEDGFVINPYDWCVANKNVNGKQITIVWHVDDLKISHEDPQVVTNCIEMLDNKYGYEACGKRSPLTVKRGRKHEYLGMVLDYSQLGKVVVDMREYIETILEDLPSEYDGDAVTPAASYLFEINEVCNKLNSVEAEMFHHVVAQLLFLCKRGRPDIQTAIAFLTTRVKEPDEDDKKKLKRCIKYIRATKDLTLTLEADGSGNIYWWVDAAFAVHRDMRSHSGGALSLGKGVIYAASRKQKLNTKSSTEAELVAIDDLMPQILWTRYFLQAQGFVVRDNILFQDNQSTMKLSKNGRSSSGKRTRHINIRYFFITDRIKSNEVNVEYCPTEFLVGDYYSKPLQGKLFRQFRNFTLNISDNQMDEKNFFPQRENKRPPPSSTKSSTVAQECVENTTKTDKNVRINLTDAKRKAKNRSYAESCESGTYACKETRYIVGKSNPSILAKLNHKK